MYYSNQFSLYVVQKFSFIHSKSTKIARTHGQFAILVQIKKKQNFELVVFDKAKVTPE